jgi:dihydropyrimidine dehydrogenase (NADP+)
LSSEPGVFCGGDLAGVAETAVEAVNDGKLAAWTIHRYLQGLHGVQVRIPTISTISIASVDST